jgi:hypothetical protein
MTRLAIATLALALAGCQDTVTVRSEGPITTTATIVVIVSATDVPRILDAVAVLPAGGAQ